MGKMAYYAFFTILITHYCSAASVNSGKPNLMNKNTEIRNMTYDLVESILDDNKIEKNSEEVTGNDNELEKISDQEILGYGTDSGKIEKRIPHIEAHGEDTQKNTNKRTIRSLNSLFNIFGKGVGVLAKNAGNIGKGLQIAGQVGGKIGVGLTVILRSQLSEKKPFDEIDLTTPKQKIDSTKETEPMAFDCSSEDSSCLQRLNELNNGITALPGRYNYNITVHNLYKNTQIYLFVYQCWGESCNNLDKFLTKELIKTISIEYSKKHIFWGYNFSQDFKLISDFSTRAFSMGKVIDGTKCALVDKYDNGNIIYDVWQDAIYKSKNGGESTIESRLSWK